MRVLDKFEKLVENELYVVVRTGFIEDSHLINKVGRCVRTTSPAFQKLMFDDKTLLYDYEWGDRVAVFDDDCRRTTADACSGKV